MSTYEDPMDREQRIKEENMACEYTIVNGTIRNPGKFEGEPEWAPYFHGVWMDGGEDESSYDDEGSLTAIFNIDASDVMRFPSLAGMRRVLMWEDDNGFVHTRAITWASDAGQ